MAITNPQKPALHGAAAESHSKAAAAKGQAKPTNTKPDDTRRKPLTAGKKSDSGKKSR